jgi:hypothetical protein
MREHREPGRRDGEPDEVAGHEAYDERRDAAKALPEHVRDQRRDARPGRCDGGEIDADEKQQRRERQGAILPALLKRN